MTSDKPRHTFRWKSQTLADDVRDDAEKQRRSVNEWLNEAARQRLARRKRKEVSDG